MRRKPTAKEPSKFLGHGTSDIASPFEPFLSSHLGWCDTFSRSGSLDLPTFESDLIAELAWSLYKAIECPPQELRGLGIHVSDLESEGGVKVDRKRKRTEPTASQPTLAKVLLGAANTSREVEKLAADPLPTESVHAPIVPSKSVAHDPRRFIQRQRDEGSVSEGDLDDAMDLEIDDLFGDRDKKGAPSKSERAVIEIANDEPTAVIPKSSIQTQLFFKLPPRDEETIDLLIGALRALPGLGGVSPAHIEVCQQLIAQWVRDCNLFAAAALVAEVEALAESQPLFRDLFEALRTTADLCTQQSYSATLQF